MRAVALAVGLLLGAWAVGAAQASAADYPPPSRPSSTLSPPAQGGRTLHVCRGRRTCFPRIQDAVNEARPGDTIRVAHGTWREGVRIVGPAKRSIRLIGDPRAPDKVVLDARRPDRTVAVGVLVDGADRITIDGFTARRYAGSGFVVARSAGYRLVRLRALHAGGAGFSVSAGVGGTLRDAEAAFNGGPGFAIGPTVAQSRPVRTVATGLRASGNAVGWWGVNVRYVTLQNSKFYNNGAGVVLVSRDPVPAPPAEDNVITGNAVFWNNVAPSLTAPGLAPGEIPPLVGVGILLLGGRRTVVTANDVYGNWLLGVGALSQPLTSAADAGTLAGNQVFGNGFGLGATDLNGRDLLYDGSGADNCLAPNPDAKTTIPASGATLADCPFMGSNAFSPAASAEAVALLADAAAHLVPHDHAPQPGLTPG